MLRSSFQWYTVSYFCINLFYFFSKVENETFIGTFLKLFINLAGQAFENYLFEFSFAKFPDKQKFFYISKWEMPNLH